MTSMKPIEGCSYDPETIEMMQSVLDEAWGSIPLKQQARVSKTEMAARILKLAASGVRDPVRLRTYALTTVISPDTDHLHDR